MLAKNIIRQIFTQGLGLFSGLVTSVITARILGPEGRGEFSLILNTSGFLSLLLGFSFSTSIVHVIATDKMYLRNTINTFSVVVLLLIVLAIVFVLVFPFHIFSFLLPGNFEQNKSFYLVALVGLFSIGLFNSFYNSILSGRKLFWEQQKVNIFFAFFSIATYGILFWFRVKYGLDFNTFIVFYLCTLLIPVIGLYSMYYRFGRPPQKFVFLKLPQIKYVMKYSLLAYLCNVFQFLSYRMDFWFVEHFKGSKDLGYYSLSVNLAQMLWVLPQAISMILLSYSGAETKAKAIENTNMLSRIAVAVIVVASVFLVLTIGYIIPFLYGKEYFESVLLFKLLLAGIVPFSVTTILASYFAGTGKMKINLYCSFIGFAVCFVADLILIPLYGNVGAAIATVLAYTLSTIFIIFVYVSSTGIRLKELILLKKTDIDVIKSKLNVRLKK